ncbi:hypothetical protein DERP_005906, partial [Dermatophagoides pteronyssinus]
HHNHEHFISRNQSIENIRSEIDNILVVLDDNQKAIAPIHHSTDNQSDNDDDDGIMEECQQIIRHHYMHRFCRSLNEQDQTRYSEINLQFLNNLLGQDIVCFCGRQFPHRNRQPFYQHLVIEHGTQYYQCTLCPGKFFQTFDDWLEHLKRDDGLATTSSENEEILRYLENDKIQKLRLWVDEFYRQTISMQLLFIDGYPYKWCTMCTIYQHHLAIVPHIQQLPLHPNKPPHSLDFNSEFEKRFDHQCKHLCYYRYVCTDCLQKYQSTTSQHPDDETNDLLSMKTYENCQLLSDINHYQQMFLSLISATTIRQHFQLKHSSSSCKLSTVSFKRWMSVDSLEYQLRKCYGHYGWNFDGERESYEFNDIRHLLQTHLLRKRKTKPFINVMTDNKSEWIRKLYQHYTYCSATVRPTISHKHIEQVLWHVSHLTKEQSNSTGRICTWEGCENILKTLQPIHLHNLVVSNLMKHTIQRKIYLMIEEIHSQMKQLRIEFSNEQMINVCIHTLIQMYRWMSESFRRQIKPMDEENRAIYHLQQHPNYLIELMFEICSKCNIPPSMESSKKFTEETNDESLVGTDENDDGCSIDSGIQLSPRFEKQLIQLAGPIGIDPLPQTNMITNQGKLKHLKTNQLSQFIQQIVLDNYFHSIRPIVAYDQISKSKSESNLHHFQHELNLMGSSGNDPIDQLYDDSDDVQSPSLLDQEKMSSYMKRYLRLIDIYDYSLEKELTECGPGCSMDNNNNDEHCINRDIVGDNQLFTEKANPTLCCLRQLKEGESTSHNNLDKHFSSKRDQKEQSPPPTKITTRKNSPKTMTETKCEKKHFDYHGGPPPRQPSDDDEKDSFSDVEDIFPSTLTPPPSSTRLTTTIVPVIDEDCNDEKSKLSSGHSNSPLPPMITTTMMNIHHPETNIKVNPLPMASPPLPPSSTPSNNEDDHQQHETINSMQINRILDEAKSIDNCNGTIIQQQHLALDHNSEKDFSTCSPLTSSGSSIIDSPSQHIHNQHSSTNMPRKAKCPSDQTTSPSNLNWDQKQSLPSNNNQSANNIITPSMSPFQQQQQRPLPPVQEVLQQIGHEQPQHSSSSTMMVANYSGQSSSYINHYNATQSAIDSSNNSILRQSLRQRNEASWNAWNSGQQIDCNAMTESNWNNQQQPICLANNNNSIGYYYASGQQPSLSTNAGSSMYAQTATSSTATRTANNNQLPVYNANNHNQYPDQQYQPNQYCQSSIMAAGGGGGYHRHSSSLPSGIVAANNTPPISSSPWINNTSMAPPLPPPTLGPIAHYSQYDPIAQQQSSAYYQPQGPSSSSTSSHDYNDNHFYKHQYCYRPANKDKIFEQLFNICSNFCLQFSSLIDDQLRSPSTSTTCTMPQQESLSQLFQMNINAVYSKWQTFSHYNH